MSLDERSNDFLTLISEIQAVKILARTSECPEALGVSPDKPPVEDLRLREATLEDLANVVKNNFQTLASGSAQGASALSTNEVDEALPLPRTTSRRAAPRVDAPEVEDKSGQAIPENERGYIPGAFPKLFPFGTGDYHDLKRGLRGKDSFADWGRLVMLWHDGRFMRHTRFRYWFLDTWLRALSPTQRNVFMKIYPKAQEATLDDLRGIDNLRTLVK